MSAPPPGLARRLAAEANGTGFLLAAVVGSGIMAERLTDDGALALLCNTLPTGAILTVLILILGPLSGAHFNPAVTLVFAMRREISPPDAIAYVAVQIAGALAGAVAAHLMFSEPLIQMSTTERAGPALWFSEFVAAFGLVAVILGAVRYRPDAVALVVGLYITSAYWFTASTSFANPAVTVARAFTDTFSGIRPLDAPAFVAAQIVGAAMAGLVLGWMLARPDRPGARAVGES